MSKKYFASLGTLRAFERKHVSLKSLVRQRYEKYKFKMLKFLRNFFIFVITGFVTVITNKNNENKKHSKIKKILLCFFGRNLLFRKEMIK